jgi:hypothetical protein
MSLGENVFKGRSTIVETNALIKSGSKLEGEAVFATVAGEKSYLLSI